MVSPATAPATPSTSAPATTRSPAAAGTGTFFFSGSNLGSDSITETSAGNTLNFYGLAALPVNLNLQQAQAGVAQTVSGNLKLTLSDPSAYGTIVGTPCRGCHCGQ